MKRCVPHNVFRTVLTALVLLCALTSPLKGAENRTAKLLLSASGVTREDIDTASRKDELTLFDVYALAVGTTERLAIEGEYSVQAQARREQAFGSFLPRVSLRAYKNFPASTRNLTTPGSQSSGIFLYARQNILTGLDQWAGLEASSYDLRLQRYLLHYNTGLLLQDVSSNFYLVAQQERSLRIQKEILSLYDKMLAELRRRVAVGRSRQSEVLRINSQMFQLLARTKSLEDGLAGNRRSLSTLTGIKAENRLAVETGLPDPEFNRDGLEDVVKNRWDVKASAERLELAKTRVFAAWGGHLPSIYLEGSYRLMEFNSNSRTTPTRDYYAALGAELPLFSGGITAAVVKEAESARRQAELGYTRTVREARQEVLDAYENWVSSGQEADAFRKALDSAEKNYEAVTGEYRLNLVTILDVLTSLTALQSARDDYERFSLQHRLDRVRLGIALNEFPGRGIEKLRSASTGRPGAE